MKQLGGVFVVGLEAGIVRVIGRFQGSRSERRQAARITITSLGHAPVRIATAEHQNPEKREADHALSVSDQNRKCHSGDHVP